MYFDGAADLGAKSLNNFRSKAFRLDGTCKEMKFCVALVLLPQTREFTHHRRISLDGTERCSPVHQ